MSMVPVVPHFRRYRGSNESIRRKTAQFNEIAQRIADHVNAQITNDPREIQQYLFGMIAIELGVDVELVREAISNGGYNGITLRIAEEGRAALASQFGARGVARA